MTCLRFLGRSIEPPSPQLNRRRSRRLKPDGPRNSLPKRAAAVHPNSAKIVEPGADGVVVAVSVAHPMVLSSDTRVLPNLPKSLSVPSHGKPMGRLRDMNPLYYRANRSLNIPAGHNRYR